MVKVMVPRIIGSVQVLVEQIFMFFSNFKTECPNCQMSRDQVMSLNNNVKM